MGSGPDEARDGLGRLADLLVGLAAAGVIGAPMVARAQQKFVCRMGHSEAIGSPLTDALGWIVDWHKGLAAGDDARTLTLDQIAAYRERSGVTV